MNKKKVTGWDYLSLGLYAFAGLGMEVLLAFVLEPKLYGHGMSEWTTGESIAHWIMTCIIWGLFITYLIKTSKKNYDFDILSLTGKMNTMNWIIIILCVVISITAKYIDWNGFKVIKEFQSKGLLKFIFQYIYYFFETGLFLLIIIFAQKAGDTWFKNDNIPWGGIAVAITWGLAHILTKGSLITGLQSSFIGLLFGIAYLTTKKNIKLALPIIFIMFAL
jgi:magnesium-transporting ATPase (P-type)